MKYDAFHKELLEFIEQEQISSLIDQDEAERIHTDLEIDMFTQVFQETIQEDQYELSQTSEYYTKDIQDTAQNEYLDQE